MLGINPKLESYIFDKLKAIYAINPEGVSYNLENDRQANLNYLGTYFPRSFVESYHIYSNLFNNKHINKAFSKKETINILDIGSGTGGNLLGLLQVLNRSYSEKRFIMCSIDGNGMAIEYQRGFIRDFNEIVPNNGNMGNLKTLVHKFTDKKSIQSTIDHLAQESNTKKFDIIHSFKFASEVYDSNPSLFQGIYKELLRISEFYLSDDGILVIEDVTKIIAGQYLPKIMSRECIEYFKQNTDSNIHFILPLSCAFWHENCSSYSCFSNKEFRIRHRYNYNDISKVTYKVIATKALAEKILSEIRIYHGYYFKISESNRNNRNNYCRNGNYHCDEEPPTSYAVVDSFTL